MIAKVCTKCMNREQWLEERRKSIGGSDVGAILGLNNYASPVSVWANKLGIIPDTPQNESMRQGTDLEEYVAKRFAEMTGLRVRKCNYIMRNDDFPHLHADVDRLVIGQDAGLECKTASALSVSKFKGGMFPGSYYAQCITYMAVTELPVWYLAVLVLGKEFKIFKIVREGVDDSCPEWCESVTTVGDDEFTIMRDMVMDFWECIESETMPDIDGSDATAQTLGAMYPGADDLKPVELDRNLIAALQAAREAYDIAKHNKAAAENAVKKSLGDAYIGTCDGVTVTWRPQNRSRLDTAALGKVFTDLDRYYTPSTTRVLRVKEDKING